MCVTSPRSPSKEAAKGTQAGPQVLSYDALPPLRRGTCCGPLNGAGPWSLSLGTRSPDWARLSGCPASHGTFWKLHLQSPVLGYQHCPASTPLCCEERPFPEARSPLVQRVCVTVPQNPADPVPALPDLLSVPFLWPQAQWWGDVVELNSLLTSGVRVRWGAIWAAGRELRSGAWEGPQAPCTPHTSQPTPSAARVPGVLGRGTDALFSTADL